MLGLISGTSFAKCQFLSAGHSFDLPFKAHGFSLALEGPGGHQMNRKACAGVTAALALIVGLDALLKVECPTGIQAAIRVVQKVCKRLFPAFGIYWR